MSRRSHHLVKNGGILHCRFSLGLHLARPTVSITSTYCPTPSDPEIFQASYSQHRSQVRLFFSGFLLFHQIFNKKVPTFSNYGYWLLITPGRVLAGVWNLGARPRSGKVMGGGELAGENASDISWKEEIGNCISPLSNSTKLKRFFESTQF